MSERIERNENDQFKKLTMHVSLLNGVVHLYGESIIPNEAQYHTEINGKIIHEFKDEHTLSRSYFVSYFVTAVVIVKQELRKMNIDSKGIELEAGWNISWTPIKEG